MDKVDKSSGIQPWMFTGLALASGAAAAVVGNDLARMIFRASAWQVALPLAISATLITPFLIPRIRRLIGKGALRRGIEGLEHCHRIRHVFDVKPLKATDYSKPTPEGRELRAAVRAFRNTMDKGKLGEQGKPNYKKHEPRIPEDVFHTAVFQEGEDSYDQRNLDGIMLSTTAIVENQDARRGDWLTGQLTLEEYDGLIDAMRSLHIGGNRLIDFDKMTSGQRGGFLLLTVGRYDERLRADEFEAKNERGYALQMILVVISGVPEGNKQHVAERFSKALDATPEEILELAGHVING